MTSTMAAFAHLSARNLDEFAPTCPSESQWYACPAESPSTFVGCCSTDPCASQNGCSQGNIRPVSFNASTHDTPAFPPDASCGTGSNFYTCIAGEAGDATVQTFWGCCKSNPCGETLECPAGELVSAYMGTPSQVQAYTGEGASSSPSPSSSASPSPSAEASSGTNKSTAIIIGGAAGGAAVFLAFLAFLIFWFCRRRKARSRTSTPDVPLTTRTAKSSAWPSEKSSVYKGAAQGSEEIPPTYTSPDPNMYPATLGPMSGYKHHYQQVDQQAQELPAELPSTSSSHRYSELPADSQSIRFAELESPDPGSRPVNGYFAGCAESPRTDQHPRHIAELASPQLSPTWRQPSPRSF